MKRFFFLVFVTLFAVARASQAQGIDTALGNTDAAAKAAAWVQNINLSTGTGWIGALSGFSAQALLTDSSRSYVDKNGMAAYYASSLFAQDLKNVRGKVLQRMAFMRKIGVLAARDQAIFGWGVIEPTKGTYNFALLDSLLTVASEYNVPFLGTIIPFNDWASTCSNSGVADVSTTCANLLGSANGADWFYLNQGKIGAVCDTAALYSFVQKLVERYDGDGVDDMPGLKAPVAYWEFGNEPDALCSGYGNERPFEQTPVSKSRPSAYSRDHSIAYRAMKAACPTCRLANGGAVESFDVPFWNSILDTLSPSKRYMDIANLHINVGKMTSPALWDWGKEFYRYVNIFQSKITQYRSGLPLWLTEWGFYSGAPTAPGSSTALPNRTEEEQAALYAKFYAWGKANDFTAMFYDLQGGAASLTSSALIQTGTGGNKARLCYHTLRMYEYKFRSADSARMISFSTSGNLSLPSGHIRFYKKGVATDVAWGLTALPSGITGKRRVTDLYGNETLLDATAISFPLASNPVIIEDALATDVRATEQGFELSVTPNPMNNGAVARFTLPQASRVRLALYDALGRQLAQITDAELAAGDHNFSLGVGFVSEGLYFLRLQTPTFFITKPVQVLR